MDEISMVAALRPVPPADAEQIRERARIRLDAALTTGGPYRRAGALRGRRSVMLAATVVAVVIAAVLAVPALLPGGAGSFVTKAWAVQRGPNGTITVTIRKTLTDQAGLQRALRADGVPAYVRSMAGCKYWQPRDGLKQTRQDWKAMIFPAPFNHDNNFSAIIIHPAALPKGYAVFIGGSAVPHGVAAQMFIMRDDGPPVCVPGAAL